MELPASLAAIVEASAGPDAVAAINEAIASCDLDEGDDPSNADDPDLVAAVQALKAARAPSISSLDQRPAPCKAAMCAQTEWGMVCLLKRVLRLTVPQVGGR
jgi:hypothetical protein